MSQESAKAIAVWLRSNFDATISARSTAVDSEGTIFRSDTDDVSVVPTSEAKTGGQAATCRARVAFKGEPWNGDFAVRAELHEPHSFARRTDAMWMAYIAARDKEAAEVLLRPWRTAEAKVPAYAVGSQRDGTETVWLDIMQWAEPFATAFEDSTGQGRVDRAVELAVPLFSGVDHLYQRWGVIHRDIDTSNVMFAGDNLVLIDWGIVSTVTEGTTTITNAMGKRNSPYVAPETKVEDGPIGGFTDAWALGVLLCEMACGERMVLAGGIGEVHLPPAASDLPRWLREIIAGLTIIDRRDRMTLRDAVAGLQAAGAGEPTRAGVRSGARNPSTATTGPMAATAPRSDDCPERRARATSLLAQGHGLEGLGRRSEAVAAYTSAIDTFDGDPDPIVRQQVAAALNNKQWSLYQMSQHAESVATCLRLVHTFGDDPDPVLRQQVAIALNSSAYSKRELGAGEHALADWNSVITRFGGDADLVLRQQVAMALRDKGLTLADLDRRVEAVGAYTTLIESFEGDRDLVLRQQVAMALNNKRWSLYWLDQHAEALATCTRLVDTCEGDRDMVVRQQVSIALRSKGLILGRARRREEAVAAYGRLVDIFANDADPTIQDSVAYARQQLRAG